MKHTRVAEANKAFAAKMFESSQRGIEESLASRGLSWKEPWLKELCDFNSPHFSVKKVAEAARKYDKAKFREANSEGTLQQLLRAGIQTGVNDIYQIVPKDFEAFQRTVSSDKAVELFAPMFKPGYPRRTDQGEEFSAPLIGLGALDVQIQAAKFGGILSITREMIEDDQSAQVSAMPAYYGERMAEIENAWCAQRFVGSAGSYGGDVIPASATNVSGESSWPYSTSFAAGGGQNKLSTLQAFSQQALVQAIYLSRQMKDPLGNLMLVSPTHIIAGTAIELPVKELCDSPNYVSTSSYSQAQSNTGSSTGVGTTFAKNMLAGQFDPLISRFLPATFCALGQAGKGFLMVRRTMLEVLQESPAAGGSFEQDVYRWRIRARWIPDWLEPRFAVLVNDGTVS